ncbi:adenylyl-sulfate kinase [Hyalangium rubrum]|uniref:Adenylyl-sulfate kinase n=1 Tax=Hyalangium rubrum TaxID=3103134 RepID=A0ABU5H498_9BACT|nr:adenylyl-sulfate kinase [Hyalangium sp. s54d21]MDY7227947.1 adenylyl-sulfate kinase [Hyalangium sp. s54d21]
MPSTTGFTLWLTGMHGTGKTTMAAYIAARLRQVGRNVEILDEGEIGDDLWQGLGDTKEERSTIVRRLGYVAQVLTRNNVAVLVPSVSPYKSGREENRRQIGRYVEVYVDCPTETLIARDSTGKYKKALSGEIPNFIGITEPYEPPNSPEVTIHSDTEAVEDGAMKIFQSLLDLGYVTSDELKIITGKKMKANPVAKQARRGEPKADKGGGGKGTGAKARPATRAARVAKPAAPAAKKTPKRK